MKGRKIVLIPHLHFYGDCKEAISLYEEAFNTKVDVIDYTDDNQINHASMKIHGQTVFLNDNNAMFNVKDISLNFPVHIIIYFQTVAELLACYEILKAVDEKSSPFVKTSYSELVGNFKDKFGMLWGFMVS
jgi:PhnB protein